MSLLTSILGRDLAKLSESGAPPLIGRPIIDPHEKSEAEFRLQHGMTRQQHAEMLAVRDRQRFEESAVHDLEGEPPNDVVCNVRGLGRQRARYARYVAWLMELRRKLDELEAKQAYFQRLIDAPAATEAEIRRLVSQDAERLMGRAGEGESSSRKCLDDRLISDRHAAEAAREALQELSRQIERVRLRVARLAEREPDFLNPAILEIADAAGLGKLYLRKIAELRAVTDLVYGLGEVTGAGFGTGFTIPSTIKLPRAGLPSLSKVSDADYVIGRVGNKDVWAALKRSLRLDLRHRAHIPLPKG